MRSAPAYPIRHTGPAIVVGSASCVWGDLRDAMALFGDAALISCNFMMARIRAAHAVTAHPEMAREQRAALEASYGYRSYAFHSGLPADVRDHGKPQAGIDYVWPLNSGGTVALIAARIGLALGYAPVLLAGCPLEPVGYVDGYPYDDTALSSGKPSGAREHWHNAWVGAKATGELEGVFSMSGFTKGLLGCL